MRQKNLFLIIFLLITISAMPQNRDSVVTGLMNALISDSEDAFRFIDSQAVAYSKRLGRDYNQGDYKFFSDYGLTKELLRKMRDEKLSYDYKIENLPEKFYRVHLESKPAGLKTTLYFENDRLINSSRYFVKYWKKRETDHITFYIRDVDGYNFYSAQLLDGYIRYFIKETGLDKNFGDNIIKNRLVYILCQSEEELEKMTGVRNGNFFMSSFDEIYTIHNVDYAMLARQLLWLYTDKNLNHASAPYFEGLNAYMGGFKNLTRTPLKDMGYYFASEGIYEREKIFLEKEFSESDKSFSIPMLVLYFDSIARKLGLKNLVDLIKDESNPDGVIKGFPVSLKKYSEETEKYLAEYVQSDSILPVDTQDSLKMLFDGDRVRIYYDGDYYYIMSRGSFNISEDSGMRMYKNYRYRDIVPNRVYEGEKYHVLVNRRDIVVYNLYTNQVIAAYYAALTPAKKSIPGVSDLFRFKIKKHVFEEPLERMKIVQFY